MKIIDLSIPIEDGLLFQVLDRDIQERLEVGPVAPGEAGSGFPLTCLWKLCAGLRTGRR